MLRVITTEMARLPIKLQRVRAVADAWNRRGATSSLAVSLPMPGEPPDAYWVEPSVEAQAELYGGNGVGANAGGVRAANVGEYQIKGIGATPLAGITSDKWHKHGALSIQDAIKEAIFSELMHAASPHGAVRAVAVLKLALTFATEIGVEKLPGSATRALFVRERGTRVAQFMRSSFLNAGADMHHREMARMRQGIPQLADTLHDAPSFNTKRKRVVSLETVSLGLWEMYAKLMQQAAMLRTKRLIHGSLIPSNFCLDGRFLDFTTSTAVSSWQPVLVALGGESTHRQQHQILQSLPELLFYLAKFDPRCAMPRAALERLTGDLYQKCSNSHNLALRQSMLLLLGLNQDEIAKLPDALVKRADAAIQRILALGTTDWQIYFGGDEHAMLDARGRDDVFAACVQAVSRALGVNPTLQSAVDAAVPSVFPRDACVALEATCRDALQSLGAQLGDGTGSFLARMIRMLQLHADMDPLYRRQLDGAIDSHCRSGEPIAPFIDTHLQRWTNLLATPRDGRTALQYWFTRGDFSLNSQNQPMRGASTCAWPELLGDSLPIGFLKRTPNLRQVLIQFAPQGSPC